MKVGTEQWAVVGGGMLGLTFAHRLAQQGHGVTLIEAAPEIGGLASAWQVADVRWDRYYHVTLASDRFTRAILRELDLDEEIQWVTTRTGFYADGRLSSMSNTLEYLKLPALGSIDKARLAMTIVVASRIKNWRKLETVSVLDWLTRWSGRKVVDKLWLPLLRAKLGDSHEAASAAFIWATIQRLYAARRSGMKSEMFGYVPGGYARVLSKFATLLASEGVELRLCTPVRAIRRSPHGGVDVDGERFDRVVATLNPSLAAAACCDLTGDERDRLRSIEYQGIVCLSLVLDRALADYYLTYITDAEAPFTAVVEMSAFVDRRLLNDQHLVYLPKYVAPNDVLFEASDEELVEMFLPFLFRMYPGLRSDHIVATKVARSRHVFPIPSIGYSRKAPPVRTSVDGLYLVSSANIVNGTLNVNDSVALAERTMEHISSAERVRA